MHVGWIGMVLFACGPQVGVPENESSGTTSTTGPEPSTTTAETISTTSSSSVGTSDPPNPTTIDPDTTTLDPETTFDPTVDSIGFIQDPEFSCSLCIECDLWLQDCPKGEKCMPWANDGGNSWNASRCSPLEADPDDIGDPCTVEGSGVSGIDTCDISAMCWDVDPKTNVGTCVPFCGGSEENPTCDAACDSCAIANDGYLILCLPLCDPSLGACPDGQVCFALVETFQCLPVDVTMVGVGEVCDEVQTTCSDGLRCVDGGLLPSCAGQTCCTPWCSQGDVDPCPEAVPGTTCVPFDFGVVPGCVDPVGYCAMG
jgi:hypothetical protein